jgi:hypothetical protein
VAVAEGRKMIRQAPHHIKKGLFLQQVNGLEVAAEAALVRMNEVLQVIQ